MASAFQLLGMVLLAPAAHALLLAPHAPAQLANRRQPGVTLLAKGGFTPDFSDKNFAPFDDDDDDDWVGDDEAAAAESLFNFDASGQLKPSALRPHLRQMLDEVASGAATVVDVRSITAWQRSHLDFTTHCSLNSILAATGVPFELVGTEPDRKLYIFSALSDDGRDAETAVYALRAAGLTGVQALPECYEALRAQLPR